MRIGITGAGETVQAAQRWLTRCKGPVEPHPDADPVLFPSFPGMESATGFACRTDVPTMLTEILSSGDLAKITRAIEIMRSRSPRASSAIGWKPFAHSRTLHRVVKAGGMRVAIPTQLAWPRTFAGGDQVQDDATRAWNFWLAPAVPG